MTEGGPVSSKAVATAKDPTATTSPTESQATELPATHSQAGVTSHYIMSIMAATVTLLLRDPISIFSKPRAIAHSHRPPSTNCRAIIRAVEPEEQALFTCTAITLLVPTRVVDSRLESQISKIDLLDGSNQRLET